MAPEICDIANFPLKLFKCFSAVIVVRNVTKKAINGLLILILKCDEEFTPAGT